MVRGAEMRYFGQLRDIDVALPESQLGEVFNADIAVACRGFHERHRELYGWGDPKLPSTLAILKVRAIGRRQSVRHRRRSVQPRGIRACAQAANARSISSPERFYRDADAMTEQLLAHGNTIVGPAVIEEKSTTIVVPPEWTVPWTARTISRDGEIFGNPG